MPDLFTWLGENWLANALSVVALLLSGYAIRAGQVRVKVRAETSIMIDSVQMSAMNGLGLSVANDGGAAVLVSSVELVDRGGRIAFRAFSRGPELPHSVDGNGGRAVWAFDYSAIKDRVLMDYRENPVVLVARVRIGSRFISAPRRFPIGVGGFTAYQPIRIRIAHWWTTQFRPPTLHEDMGLDTSKIDFDSETYVQGFTNGTRRTSPRQTLNLMISVPGVGNKRVVNVQPIRVPRVRAGKTAQVTLPFRPAGELADTGTRIYWQTFPTEMGQTTDAYSRDDALRALEILASMTSDSAQSRDPES